MSGGDPRPPVVDYRRRPTLPPPTSAPVTAGWVMLLACHAVLTLVGAFLALAGLVVVCSFFAKDGSTPGPSLACCGLPAAPGVLCLWVGVRGMYPLGSGNG